MSEPETFDYYVENRDTFVKIDNTFAEMLTIMEISPANSHLF